MKQFFLSIILLMFGCALSIADEICISVPHHTAGGYGSHFRFMVNCTNESFVTKSRIRQLGFLFFPGWKGRAVKDLNKEISSRNLYEVASVLHPYSFGSEKLQVQIFEKSDSGASYCLVYRNNHRVEGMGSRQTRFDVSISCENSEKIRVFRGATEQEFATFMDREGYYSALEADYSSKIAEIWFSPRLEVFRTR